MNPATSYPYPLDEARRREVPGPGWQLIAGLPVWAVYAAVLFARRHPAGLAGLTLAGLVAWLAGPLWTLAGIASTALVLTVWRVSDRATFDQLTAGPRTQLRGLGYRRRWHRVMRSVGLVDAATGWAPLLLRVSSPAPSIDRLHVRPLSGQSSVEWLDRADQLASMLGATALAVTPGPRGTAWIDLERAAVRPSERLEARPGSEARPAAVRSRALHSGPRVAGSGDSGEAGEVQPENESHQLGFRIALTATAMRPAEPRTRTVSGGSDDD